MSIKNGPWDAFLAYSYTDPTSEAGFVESAGSDPDTDVNGDLTIAPGDRLAGIPTNQMKFGASYQLTEPWNVGISGLFQSGQYLFGEESNLNPRLPSFVTINLRTFYQITPHIELFGREQRSLLHLRHVPPTNSVNLAQAAYATNRAAILLRRRSDLMGSSG